MCVCVLCVCACVCECVRLCVRETHTETESVCVCVCTHWWGGGFLKLGGFAHEFPARKKATVRVKTPSARPEAPRGPGGHDHAPTPCCPAKSSLPITSAHSGGPAKSLIDLCW